MLEKFVRNPNTAESTIEDRIEQVLSRVGGGSSSAADSYQPQRSTQLSSSSRETASPISGSGVTHQTNQSGTTMTTPLSTFAAGAVGMAAAAANAVNSTLTGATSTSDGGAPAPSRGGVAPSDGRSSAGNTTRSMATLPDTDFGLQHLYTVVDAASRKKAPRKRVIAGSRHVQQGGSIDYKPTVAGLFPPPAPVISDKKVKDIYAPIGKHLNSLEDTLDQLLSDALRTF